MSKEKALKDEEIEKQEQEATPETDNLNDETPVEGDKESEEESGEEAENTDVPVEENEQEELDDTEKPKAKKKGIFGMGGGKNRELEEELEESRTKLAEVNDKYLRLFSEFDNFRKRTAKEKVELYKTAAEDVIKDLLQVVDDFERAIQNTPDSEDTKAHMEGMMLIYHKLQKLLEQKGVKEIEAHEQAFDTDLHEAITKIPAPTEELKGKVVDVVEKGYTLNDKVIRFAKVVIGE